MNADGSGLTNLTQSPEIADFMCAWAPDGMQIAFVSICNRMSAIYLMNRDGSGTVQVTTGPNGLSIHTPTWSPDGKRIAFMTTERYGEIHVVNIDGTGLLNLTDNRADDGYPSWSWR